MIKIQTLKNIPKVIAIVLFFAACTDKKEKSNEETGNAISVQTETVSSTPKTNEITFSGNVEGTTTVKLGFMVPGKINLIASKVGQLVSKGQLVASLEATDYTLNKQLADVQLNEAKDEYRRLKILHDKGSLSESDFSKISTSLQKAEIQQKLTVKNLSDARLFTPIDGVLLSKQAEVGEIISAGTPLFVVSDIRKVTVLAFVPEGELSGLHIGQSASINIAALGKTFSGQITEVGAIADAASRAFTVKIGLDNAGLHIRPGMIAEARIIFNGQKKGILLPVESIINDSGNQSYVYVADKTGGKAFKRKVSLGKMSANKIEIVSGLSVGETVVTSGQTKLSDGALITIAR
ncbi:efflux RND transporter periplasmic adaptor subunit [Mucilaginibacter sp. SJ]|uniref:efflux RND transporter periplasmic adaptor subunit n=1 Tax=Mucilaginibacter sp. SJ TaxID=3029053 RepID=UPI0023A95704|nr:efflux RND transporter periplasmic adaptor subunit [Mucilaginibacter sp. SJ]WEA00632.1 efflux RND transporter periplasmic adaptor subunit [Mucilaginibacter sp. SJ]